MWWLIVKQKESFIHEMVGLTVKLTFVYNELISFIKTILIMIGLISWILF